MYHEDAAHAAERERQRARAPRARACEAIARAALESGDVHPSNVSRLESLSVALTHPGPDITAEDGVWILELVKASSLPAGSKPAAPVAPPTHDGPAAVKAAPPADGDPDTSSGVAVGAAQLCDRWGTGLDQCVLSFDHLGPCDCAAPAKGRLAGANIMRILDRIEAGQ
jgi:hypothetical protein